MKIFILGSRSGTEPFPGRLHTSWILQTDKGNYWFDAGSGCSENAYNSGIDPFETQGLFITHRHIDHVGGLPNLFWLFHKLQSVQHRKMVSPLPVYTPTPALITKAQEFLEAAECRVIPLDIHQVTDGEIFNDGNVRIEAQHNLHLGIPDSPDQWGSFSYLIHHNEKKILFSGDLKSIDELSHWIPQVDLMLMETGHHDPVEICRKFAETPSQAPKQLLFIHHGRTILNHFQETLQACKTFLGSRVDFAWDNMKIIL